MKIFAAPLQGLTESSWRTAHASLAGGIDEYFTPFLRVEKGAVRSRDFRDFMIDCNAASHAVTPQAIFRDMTELRMIVETLTGAGAKRIDLNIGCPFPPQVRKGRGAALLGRVDELKRLKDLIGQFPEIEFSVKMRIGIDDPSQWREAIWIINEMPLRHVAVHPRTAAMQYAGDLLLDQFDEVVELCRKPLIFNGDLSSPGDISNIVSRYPELSGVMIGRGLLRRPTLAAEWRSGEESQPAAWIEMQLKIHDAVFDQYASTILGGDHQLLQKMKPFWPYCADLLPRKTAKAIHKSTTLEKYLTAVGTLR